MTVELRIGAGGGGGVGQLRSLLAALPCDCVLGLGGWGGVGQLRSLFYCVTVPLSPGGVGWGSYVRLLLRDRATASWGWGWRWGGAVTFASYCVTMRLHPGAGEGGN